MIPDLHEMFDPEKVDEAAATIATFLNELVMQFEGRYFVQIRRHRARHEPARDPNQPWLLLPPGPD
jgi:hypothetical protein